ncbi:succinyl-diaminopimelate desuccinylase [Phaeovibrio sulfidiphilus]|uniref:Succinyl-diaminopimelate desuccinylase n=1 Tax=Phaeovibrio sulfidiphilus TaxID=1220600 RepID=A0A8J6YU11_9PROT|nr:succinyl-diaminopimelate desuccinylase [Phaeovibrio sulfidiphilus]MBE1236404.1 succinyl-diaminopimelate desuccinylase [Phaeovibrio sulfidiphilus]
MTPDTLPAPGRTDAGTAPAPAWTFGDLTDPVQVLRALVACKSVTPVDDGALDVVQSALEALGFTCTRIASGVEGATGKDARVDNLFAVRGTSGPAFGFAGHTDVVPAGDGWSADPFGGEVRDGHIFGRGVADMKGGIAAFIAALARQPAGFPGTGRIALLITGDEEGPAVHGTLAILKWMKDNGVTLDHCLIGEPTNATEMGQEIKVGRRGSINVTITVNGTGGHVAHPHRANNPVHRAIRLAAALTAQPLDRGTPHFQPSSLQVTSIDVGNTTTNVIPSRALIRLNIRFNDLHTGASLEAWLRERCLEACEGREDFFSMETSVCGEAFLTKPERLARMIADAAELIGGQRPVYSTSGGTSDARFINTLCPTAEYGLVGRTMHQANESVAVDDLEQLTRIYDEVLKRYFEDA